MDEFVLCRKIEESLRKRSTTECLAWCSENRVSLRKLKVVQRLPLDFLHLLCQSTLEFDLRLQQFVELVREGRRKDAMMHSKKFLAPYQGTHFSQIQAAAGLLAMVPTTHHSRYKVRARGIVWSCRP